MFKFFHTPPKRVRGEKKKFVSFVAAAGDADKDPSLSWSFSSTSSSSTSQPPDEKTLKLRGFIKPSVCTICGNCMAAVSRSLDTKYSHLLLVLIQLFRDQDFVKSVFSSLDSNHHRLIVRQLRNHPLKQKLLTLCSVLTKAARLDSVSPQSAKFTENILESLVLLLDGHLVDSTSAVMLLGEIIKVYSLQNVHTSCNSHTVHVHCINNVRRLIHVHTCMYMYMCIQLYLAHVHVHACTLYKSLCLVMLCVVWSDKNFAFTKVSLVYFQLHVLLNSLLPTDYVRQQPGWSDCQSSRWY